MHCCLTSYVGSSRSDERGLQRAQPVRVQSVDYLLRQQLGAVARATNYVSDDGRTGIDNQRFAFQGCITGYRGRKSLLMGSSNENRRSGDLSILVAISGIDDEKNDDSIHVTLLHSLDPMAKDATGAKILEDYTFRITDKPEYT